MIPTPPQPQRRAPDIAMTAQEIDAFLSRQRVCRIATVGPEGPHVGPLWFYWDGRALWLNSLVASQRWVDIRRDNRVAVVVDAGSDMGEIRGVEIRGRAMVVGEVPRVGTEVPELDGPELEFHRKYRDPNRPVLRDGRHAFLKVVPDRLVSWDFHKRPPDQSSPKPEDSRP